MDRRRFIQMGLVAVGSAVVAGCVSANVDGEESAPVYDLPPYSDWVPTERSDAGSDVVFTHVDWEKLDALDSDDDSSEEDSEEDIALIGESPIVALPFYGATISAVAMLGILFYPFAGEVIPDEGPPAEGIETSALTVTGDTIVFHGTYSPDVFANYYGEDEGFTEATERDGFTVYEGTDGFTNGMMYAVSEDTLVVGLSSDEEDAVDIALDRVLDETGRVIDEDDGRWLFETTGEGSMAFGVWNTDDFQESLLPDEDLEDEVDDDIDSDVEDNPVFDDVESLVNNLTFDVEEGEMVDLEARFSGLYPADSVPSEDEIRDHLFGNLIDDVPHDIVIDDHRVHASVTFEEPPDQVQ